MDLLEVFFPKKCAGCGKLGEYVCKDCGVGIWEEEQICPDCGKRSFLGKCHKECINSDLLGFCSIFAYDGLAKRIIEKAKHRQYYDVLNILTPTLTEFEERGDLIGLVSFIAKHKPVIVPVPLWPKRERARGFNQALVAGKIMGKRFNLRIEEILIRDRDTGTQVCGNRRARFEKVRGAFKARSKYVGRVGAVLLVDDVWTTGATLRGCAKELKKIGVKQIWGVTLGR